ncbi:MAG TPA: pitrilysin family protein [Thermoanaerobaculia bacterium]|nr:pitrilysin family protein [Thermoanaerobaculia bacterium]
MTTDRKTIGAAALCLTLMAGAAHAQGNPQGNTQGNSGGQAAAPQANTGSGIDLVTLPSPDSPLVAIRLMFDVGSIHDPKGKEGLAALTAQMISQGSTQKRSYSELLEAFYPMAAGLGAQPDREVTVFQALVHRETLADYTALLQEVMLQPAFAESDFTRIKQQLQAFLTNGLRSGSDELLGLELMQQAIFEDHPYGHHPAGTVQGLQSITLDDVRRFYKEHYTQGNLMLGVAGGYPQGYPESLAKALAALPAGQRGRTELPPVPKVQGRNFTLVDKQTTATGIHFGFPLPINRTHPDFYPLLVANSYLGEHRTFYGRLMQQLRGKRGLNYGDYSYVEFWPNPPFTDNPLPGVPRRQQYFSVWIRPVVPSDAQFALRAGLYELQRLYTRGLTQEDFELTRNYLVNRKNQWVQSLMTRLGYVMDSRYYGMPYYIDELDKNLRAMTVEDVNRVVKKYMNPDNYDAVLIATDASRLRDILQKDEPSPKTYVSEVEKEVTDADKTIVPLKVKPTSIEVVPVQQVLEK